MKRDNDNTPIDGNETVSNKPLRFLSVCSGIEAASVAFGPLGWKAVAFSEIEKFPSAVLAHHYPDVPNLGDMTKFKEWPDFEIDMLCGGTPCQPYSVAGLRQGLADPRGNLTLTFLAIADKYEPEWIVWENVPGILSDKTGALVSFLDGLEELGYVVDVDIEDAQFFGLAQRRRRIVVCGQHVKHILNKRTNSSALTIAQCLSETLLSALAVLTIPLTSAQAGLDSRKTNASHSLMRKMKLFDLHAEGQALMLAWNLGAILESSECAQSGLVLEAGLNSAVDTKKVKDTKQRILNAATASYQGELAYIAKSLPMILADLSQIQKESTTLTWSKETIESKIYSFAKMSLSIARLTLQSTNSSPVYWSAVQSNLTAMKEFTSYARQTSSDLFGDVSGIHAWGDFIREAEPTIKSLGDIGIESFGTVLPISAGLSRNPPARGKAGQDVAPTISARTKGGGGLGTDFDLDGDLVQTFDRQSNCEYGDADLESTVSARDYKSPTDLVAYAIQAGALRSNPNSGPDGVGVQENHAYTLEARSEVQAVCITGEITHALKAEGADASEDGTGRGNPIVFGWQNSSSQGLSDSVHVSPTLDKSKTPAVAVSLRGREGGGTAELGDEIANALRASGGGGDKAHVLTEDACLTPWDSQQKRVYDGSASVAPALSGCDGGGGRNPPAYTFGSAVRRLTPVECERLQGFPDNYTNIPWRSKPTSPDGPRYKALGNSWAVPKFRWIGERINRMMPLANDNQKAAA